MYTLIVLRLKNIPKRNQKTDTVATPGQKTPPDDTPDRTSFTQKTTPGEAAHHTAFLPKPPVVWRAPPCVVFGVRLLDLIKQYLQLKL